jgi:microcystin-dependent protein
MDGAMIAFAPHATNGATVTLNVDGLGSKPLRSASGVELLAAMLIQSSVYAASYNNSNGEWILHGIFGNPYNVPLLAGMEFWGTTAPNSSFILPLGQALSRATYAAAFAIMGTTYGAGDGSTTFNVPDLGGRAVIMKEASATRLTSAGGGVDGGTMGAVGGAQNGTISQANLPNASLTLFGSATVNSTVSDVVRGNPTVWLNGSGGSLNAFNPGQVVSQQITSTGSISGIAALGGSGTAFKTVQPTIVGNKIIRII